MNKLKIYLENCYGIAKFDEEFDFSRANSDRDDHTQTQLIYAQNGVMKSSFAKTFKDISEGKDPRELVYGRTSKFVIESDGSPIDPEIIFVVESKARYFESEKMATLLADKATQQEYLEIMNDFETATTGLFKPLMTKLKCRGTEDVIAKFDAQFGTDEENRLARLLSMKTEVSGAQDEDREIDYRLLEDKKVTDFLDKQSTHIALKDYFETYEKLVAESKYYKKDLFDYINALNSSDAIDKNNFLKVGNTITLTDGTVVKDAKELERLFLDDKDRIFNDPELKKKYNALDEAMRKNEKLKEFRIYISKNQEIVPRLQNHKLLRSNIWYSYFNELEVEYNSLVDTYDQSKDDLQKIYAKSEKLGKEWQAIVSKFNRSFDAPFHVSIKNKKDAILKSKRPVLEFQFKDKAGGVGKVLDISFMNENILSTGESRALYILCVMFEIECRIKQSGDHLIILDDIADSFDYRNKYAIIEYLHTVSRSHTNGLNLVIMTHNFDFFRTVQMRLWGKAYREKTRLAERSKSGEITLVPAKSFHEFDRLRQEINNSKALFVSSIPFARNLIEYGEGMTAGYDLLTDALHVKGRTKTLKAADILAVTKTKIRGVDESKYGSSLYVDILNDAVQEICSATPHVNSLENKITCAIAARLKAEEYMINELVRHDATYTPNTTRDQTAKIFGDYSANIGEGSTAYPVLNRVILMTPESIHINSFMYEPLVDMSIAELVALNQDLDVL